MNENLEAIKTGLSAEVDKLNMEREKKDKTLGHRPIHGKTLRKTFYNWMTLAGMSHKCADAIEARDQGSVTDESYASTADTEGQIQYPKAVRILLDQFPIPKWMEEYKGFDEEQFKKEKSAGNSKSQSGVKHNAAPKPKKETEKKNQYSGKRIVNKDLWKLGNKGKA